MIVFFIILLIIVIAVIVGMYFAENNSSNNAHTFNSTKQEYPVSKEQLSIFVENWTLTEFKKKFGKFEIKNCTNHTTLVQFKCCLFGKSVWVRFASSLNEPSFGEIKRREKELMVGFTGKNYILYDNKIQKWEVIDIDS